jgi:hypothetical protein
MRETDRTGERTEPKRDSGLAKALVAFYWGRREEEWKKKKITMMTITIPSPRALLNGVEAIH